MSFSRSQHTRVLLEERDATGGLLASYVYGKDLLSRTTDGVSRYYLYDGFLSVRALSDADGRVTDNYAYGAYGMLLDDSSADANPYRYRGEQYDTELDAYYLRARYYQPGIGRFLTTDSFEGLISASQSLHRYMYGYADPVNNLDPSGKINLNEFEGVDFLMNDMFFNSSSDAAKAARGFTCGPDVTLQLDNTITQAREMFESYFKGKEKEKKRACRFVHNYHIPPQIWTFVDYANAWDILNIARIGSGSVEASTLWFGTKDGRNSTPETFSYKGPLSTIDCRQSLAYHGECYSAANLNYILWGLINKICYDDEAEFYAITKAEGVERI